MSEAAGEAGGALGDNSHRILRLLLGRLIGRIPRRVWTEAAVVALIFTALAIAVSWPLVLHMNTRILGGGAGGDPTGYLWDIWYAVYHELNLVGSATQEYLGVPFGRPVAASTNSNQLLSLLPAWLVGEFSTPAAGMNVASLLSLILPSVAMYGTVRFLGAGRLVAGWAGIVFMIFPYHLIREISHLPLGQLVSFPLLVVCGLWWAEHPTIRRGSAYAAALLVAWLSHPYYGIMGSVLLAVTVAVVIVRRILNAGIRPAVAAVVSVAVPTLAIVGVPLAALFVASRSSVATSFSRDVVELEVYGAHLRDYVVPDGGAWLPRRLFGDNDWIPHAAPGGERTAFLGWLTLALVIVAVAALLRGALTPRQRTAVLVALPSSLVLLLFSLASPTVIFGHRIQMPSRVVFEVVPYLRAYGRFSAAVMAVLIPLAAVGLSVLVRGRAPRNRAVIVSVAVLLSVAELSTHYPLGSDYPARIDGIPGPQVPEWQWLRNNDRGAVVLQTPAYDGAYGEILDRYYMYGQMIHDHPLANGGLHERTVVADFTQMVGDPRLPLAPARYRMAGIDYVVTSGWAYRVRGLEAPDLAGEIAGLEPVARFPDATIWRVTAPPTEGMGIFARNTWWPPEERDGVTWRWMRDQATVRFYAPRPGTYRVSFPSRSWRTPRTLDVRIGSTVITAISVGASVSTTTFELTVPRGVTNLELVRHGAPAYQVSAVDQRVVSIHIGEWTVHRVGD